METRYAHTSSEAPQGRGRHYAYGLMMPGRTFTAGQETREGYTGHELDAETGMYYAGARYYMPALARWTAIDPHAASYLHLSPYVYVTNNPLLYVDPDGRDYVLHCDESKGTVTIQANYYTTSEGLESAQHAADFWNSQSGNFRYVVGRGDSAQSFTVDFDINVIEVDVDPSFGTGHRAIQGSLNQAMRGDPAGNVYMVVSDDRLRSDQGGTTIGGNFIRVKDSYSMTSVAAHEVGHTLGLGHSSRGVMTETHNDPRRGEFVTRDDMTNMIRNPVVGRTVVINGAPAGRGIVNVTGSITQEQLRRGRIR